MNIGGEYTKGEFITLCSKGIHQRMNLDRTIFDAYIDRYAAAAINFVNIKQYYLDANQEGFKEINGAFIGVYEAVPVKFNDYRKLHYIELPAKLLPVPMDRAITYIGPIDESEGFILTSQQDIFSMGKHMNMVAEVFGSVEGTNVMLRNCPHAIEDVMVKMLVSFSDLGEDDYVGIPYGSEGEAINIVVEFFLGVRKLPENKLNDNRTIDAKQ